MNATVAEKATTPETAHCHQPREVRKARKAVEKAVEKVPKEKKAARKAERVARARSQVEVSTLH